MVPILMFILVAIGAVAGLQAPAQPKTGVIEGHVMREGTTKPIEGALVTLLVPGGPSSLSPETLERQRIAGLAGGQSLEQVQASITSLLRNEGALAREPAFVLTDAAGKFTFKDVPAGRYSVRAEREGYVSTEINESYQTGAVKNISVAEEKTASCDLFLLPSGIISGQVRDPIGQPAVGVTVGVFRLIYSASGRHSFAGGRSVTTDDRGQYRIVNVAPGYLYVGVTPRNPTPGSREESWERTFYPGVIEAESAERISVVIGGENSGINIDLKPRGQTYKISGRATNNAAVPDPTTGVIDRTVNTFYLAARNPGYLDPAPNFGNLIPVNARPNGEFEIRGVRRGSYELSAYTIDPTNRRPLLSHVPVDVKDEDITALSLAISPGMTLSGEVQVRGGSSDAVRFSALQLSLQNELSLPIPTIAFPVEASGRFSVERIPESRYRLQVSGLPPNAYVVDVLQGGLSVFDSGFNVDARSGPMQVILSPEGQTVAGIVATSAGEVVSGATVVLVPPVGIRQNVSRFKTATSDESGRFTIRGVAPGQYTAYAWVSIYAYSWLDAKRLEKSASYGRTVTILPGGAVDLQLRAIPAGN